MPPSMLNRSLHSLILAFALLFVQHGALWHGVSHAHTAPNSQQDQSLPHAEQCAKCLSFAHTSAAAAATPLVFATPSQVQVQIHIDLPAAYSTQPSPYQSRAPPVLA